MKWAAVVLLAVLFLGCAEVEQVLSPQTTSPTRQTTTWVTTTTTTTTTTLSPVVAFMVRLYNMKANPETVTIARGKGVTWLNDDPIPHSIEGDGFKSPKLETGEMHTQVFNETGIYYYRCGIHKRYMQGTIIVE